VKQQQPALVDKLEMILRDLSGRAPGVKGSVLCDSRGLPVASSLPAEFEIAVIAAMGTLMTKSASSVYANMRFSRPELVVIEGREADVAAIELPGGIGSLIVILEKGGNLGLLKIEIKRAAMRVVDAHTYGGEVPPRISELFVLHSSGALIRHYSDTLRTDLDRDILGGMLTAIQSFVKEALATSDSLDEMRFGEHAICFVRGEHTIAAYLTDVGCADARYLVFDALEDFEGKYSDVLVKWDGRVQSLAGVDDCFTKVLHS